MKNGCHKLKRRFSEAGAAMVEFAVSAPAFLLLVLGGLEVTLASYQSTALQYTLATAMRQGTLSTSVSIPAPVRTDMIKSQIVQIGTRYGLNLNPSQVKICSASSFTTPLVIDPNCADSAGGAQDFVMIRIEKEQQFLFGQYPFKLEATVVGRNEPA